MTASIVDVADLADGTGIGGGVVVQLWRNDCTEILSSKWRSVDWTSLSYPTNRRSTSFALPRAAKWMTVTTNDTALLPWTLRRAHGQDVTSSATS